MENMCGHGNEDEQLELPPGFRFHPTDEELISHYLYQKVIDPNFSCTAIGEVDLNKSEPWDLPRKAKMGEKEWYFFCMRDRKYPTGLRTNRATEAGYWKATGKDKEIYRGKSLVGMKKTLVFYRGRAPRGEKSNWVMHEYRLDGRLSPINLPKTARNECVISRVFSKNSGGKKIHISGLVKMGGSYGNEFDPTVLPPLTDSSPFKLTMTKPAGEPAYVPCFSNSIDSQRTQQQQQQILVDSYSNPYLSVISSPPDIFPRIPHSNPFYSAQPNYQLSSTVLMEEQSILRSLLDNHGSNMKHIFKSEREMISVSQETGLTTDMNNEISSVVSNLEMGKRPFDDQEAPSTSAGPVDLDVLWNY